MSFESIPSITITPPPTTTPHAPAGRKRVGEDNWANQQNKWPRTNEYSVITSTSGQFNTSGNSFTSNNTINNVVGVVQHQLQKVLASSPRSISNTSQSVPGTSQSNPILLTFPSASFSGTSTSSTTSTISHRANPPQPNQFTSPPDGFLGESLFSEDFFTALWEPNAVPGSSAPLIRDDKDSSFSVNSSTSSATSTTSSTSTISTQSTTSVQPHNQFTPPNPVAPKLSFTFAVKEFIVTEQPFDYDDAIESLYKDALTCQTGFNHFYEVNLRNPTDMRAIYWMGRFCMEVKDFHSGYFYLSKIPIRNEYYCKAQDRIAISYFDQGEIDKAFNCWEEVLGILSKRLDPSINAVRFHLAQGYFEKERCFDAREQLIRIPPKDPYFDLAEELIEKCKEKTWGSSRIKNVNGKQRSDQ